MKPVASGGRGVGRVGVVIVNYRTGGLVADCLASLRPEVEARPDTEVLIVDNASGDDSCDRIEAAIDALGARSWARLIRSPVNAGFAAGNNLALRHWLQSPSKPDAFWLLNPDTRVMPGALSALVTALDDDPVCGIAGSQLLEADGSPWPFAFRFPSIAGEFEACARLGVVTRWFGHHAIAREMDTRPNAPRATVDWVSGASFIVRARMIETIGLMDERFFLYYEETELARRARDAGWSSVYAPDSQVLHISGQSTGVTGDQSERRRRPRYWFESRGRYFEQAHGRGYALMADLACLAGSSLWHLARLVRLRPNTDPPYFMTDVVINAWRRLRGAGYSSL